MVPRFATTRWSLVISAGNSSDEASAALGELCRLYWGSVYLFIRRRLRGDHETALDVTQQLFTSPLARNDSGPRTPTSGLVGEGCQVAIAASASLAGALLAAAFASAR